MEPPRLSPRLAILDRGESAEEARRLSQSLNLPVVQPDEVAAYDGLLQWIDGRLELRWVQATTPIPGESRRSAPLRADLTALDVTSGPGRSLRQPLARAVGLRSGQPRPRVVDATGGLGEDAWLLAAWGCEVVVCERHPVVAALLADGLAHAAASHPQLARRIALHRIDAAAFLSSLAPQQQPDVVYLDPMFPTGHEPALPRRPMRILRQLVGDDADAEALLALSRTVARRRVVVKRPAWAAPLHPQCAAQHRGRGYRFDVYLSAVR